MNEDEYCIRHFDIDLTNQTLILHQKLVGDVCCVVWDAAIVLAKYLEKKCKTNRGYLKGAKIVELGAGLGCVGLAAACLGADVLMTDLSAAIPLLEYNVNKNKSPVEFGKGNAKALELNWGEDSKIGFVPDKIILSDCIYYEESIDPLLQTLRELAGSETEILIAQELRDLDKQKANWDNFLLKLQDDFAARFVPLEEQSETFSCPDIKLLVAMKR